jgi:ATP-dependent Lon protease
MAFDGFLVRKDLVRKYSRHYPVPTYVVEFLLGRYCASTDPAAIEEGLLIVEKQLQGRTVRTGEEELFKARARDQGSVKIIDIVRARLDTRSDSYMAEVQRQVVPHRRAQANPDVQSQRAGDPGQGPCCLHHARVA